MADHWFEYLGLKCLVSDEFPHDGRMMHVREVRERLGDRLFGDFMRHIQHVVGGLHDVSYWTDGTCGCTERASYVRHAIMEMADPGYMERWVAAARQTMDAKVRDDGES